MRKQNFTMKVMLMLTNDKGYSLFLLTPRSHTRECARIMLVIMKGYRRFQICQNSGKDGENQESMIILRIPFKLMISSEFPKITPRISY